MHKNTFHLLSSLSQRKLRSYYKMLYFSISDCSFINIRRENNKESCLHLKRMQRLTGACSVPSSLSMLPLLFLDSVFYKKEEQNSYNTNSFSQQLPSRQAWYGSCTETSLRVMSSKTKSSLHTVENYISLDFSTWNLATSQHLHHYHILCLFQYRFGEAGLEEMHPGRTQWRRKAESRGHRKMCGDGVREVERQTDGRRER